mgnify:CR=1 FL=1
MFGETISFAEGLMVTFLGMSVVFLALIFLMVIIKVMEKVLYRDPAKSKPDKAAVSKPVAADTSPAKAVTAAEASEYEDDAGELIAVISAAAASCMGLPESRLFIKDIVRLPDSTPIWGLSGRMSQQGRRL